MSFSNLIGTVRAIEGHWTHVYDNILVFICEDPASELTVEYFLPGLRINHYEDDGYMCTKNVADLPSSFDDDGKTIVIPDNIRKSHASLSKYAPNLLMNVDINADGDGFKLVCNSFRDIVDDLDGVCVCDKTFVQIIDNNGHVYMSIDGNTQEYLGSLKGTSAFETIKRDVSHKSYKNFRGFSDINVVAMD